MCPLAQLLLHEEPFRKFIASQTQAGCSIDVYDEGDFSLDLSHLCMPTRE